MPSQKTFWWKLVLISNWSKEIKHCYRSSLTALEQPNWYIDTPHALLYIHYTVNGTVDCTIHYTVHYTVHCTIQ